MYWPTFGVHHSQNTKHVSINVRSTSQSIYQTICINKCLEYITVRISNDMYLSSFWVYHSQNTCIKRHLSIIVLSTSQPIYNTACIDQRLEYIIARIGNNLYRRAFWAASCCYLNTAGREHFIGDKHNFHFNDLYSTCKLRCEHITGCPHDICRGFTTLFVH